jgi:hypothetical protein
MRGKKLAIQLLWSIAFLIIISGLHSCNSCKQKNKEVQNINYQKISNARYHFSFSIPESWNAMDISDNGDGYFISTPDSVSEIKVYGEMIVNDKNQFLSAHQTMHEFTFDDGYIGKMYKVDPVEILVSRSDSMIRVSAYLHTANSNNIKLKEQFMKIAKSLHIE